MTNSSANDNFKNEKLGNLEQYSKNTKSTSAVFYLTKTVL